MLPSQFVSSDFINEIYYSFLCKEDYYKVVCQKLLGSISRCVRSNNSQLKRVPRRNFRDLFVRNLWPSIFGEIVIQQKDRREVKTSVNLLDCQFIHRFNADF